MTPQPDWLCTIWDHNPLMSRATPSHSTRINHSICIITELPLSASYQKDMMVLFFCPPRPTAVFLGTSIYICALERQHGQYAKAIGRGKKIVLRADSVIYTQLFCLQ